MAGSARVGAGGLGAFISKCPSQVTLLKLSLRRRLAPQERSLETEAPAAGPQQLQLE